MINLNGTDKSKNIELLIFISLCNGILEKHLLFQIVVLGSMSAGRTIIDINSLQIASGVGAKKILILAADMVQMAKVPTDNLFRSNRCSI